MGTELEMSVWLSGSSRGLLGYILATCPCRLRQAGLSCQLVSFRKEDSLMITGTFRFLSLLECYMLIGRSIRGGRQPFLHAVLEDPHALGLCTPARAPRRRLSSSGGILARTGFVHAEAFNTTYYRSEGQVPRGDCCLSPTHDCSVVSRFRELPYIQ